MKRRDFMLASGATLPILGTAKQATKLKVMIAGGHPDDPETGCGGVAAIWAAQGHDVILTYLTTGEAGINGTSADAAAKIRKNEAEQACKILGTRPIFLGQIDGQAIVNNEWYKKVADLLKKESPDLLLTHWAVDTHRDHRACSMLFYDAWLNNGRKEALYFFEVMTGQQSQNFNPTDYVDITKVVQKKHDACFIHKSQKIEAEYPNSHDKMEVFRGLESGFKFAEAFIKHSQSRASSLFG